MERLQNLIGKEVIRVFLKVWPPLGEDELGQVDLTIGLVFSDNTDVMLEIGTNISYGWGFNIEECEIPSFLHDWTEYESRMKEWFVSDEERFMEIEYFEVTKEDMFNGFLGEILNAELMHIDDSDNNPFGVKLIFDTDYLMQFPISSGGTIETKTFNCWGLLNHYNHLGEVRFTPLVK
jgi:hypothetical protein